MHVQLEKNQKITDNTKIEVAFSRQFLFKRLWFDCKQGAQFETIKHQFT